MKYFFALTLGILLFLPIGTTKAFDVETVVFLINAERDARGLSVLSLNEKLQKAAKAKAYSVALSGRLEHTSSLNGELWKPLKDAGYSYALVGENLGVNIADPTALVSEWMASPSHRANILNPEFEDVAVAVQRANFLGDSADYIVLYTAKPKQVSAASAAQAVTGNVLVEGKEEVEDLITKLLLIINELMKKTDSHA
jgi:hypothetical protein